jgi:hypothetical protein
MEHSNVEEDPVNSVATSVAPEGCPTLKSEVTRDTVKLCGKGRDAAWITCPAHPAAQGDWQR